MLEILDKVKNATNIYTMLEQDIQKTEVGNAKAISFVNPFSYLELRKQDKLLSELDYLYTDAISSAKIFSALFGKTIPRISFDLGSFARHFLEQANKFELPIYFVGAKEHELNQAVNILKKEFPDLNVVGFKNGYFSDDEAAMGEIIASGAQYVICGMGTPRQDEFACKLKNYHQGQIKQIYTCGGFLLQSSEKLNYYPKFINKYNLRWLYRALSNSHVAKRLLFSYPKFFFIVMYDFFSKKK